MDEGHQAEAERDRRLGHPWHGPSRAAVAVWTGESAVTASTAPWARELAAMVPASPVAEVIAAVAEGFCPVHGKALDDGGGSWFPWCGQCRASWTVTRGTVFIDRIAPPELTWQRLALVPFPSAGSEPGQE